MLTRRDKERFHRGDHDQLYRALGAHRGRHRGARGWRFGVWAPGAASVSVIGDFNDWDPDADRLVPDGELWRGFVRGARVGDRYKLRVDDVDKADPFAVWSECPPKTASRLADLSYTWGDQAWMESRSERNGPGVPRTIYEVHLGSWRPGLGYREVADPLIAHCTALGFTHVELMPVMEHPFFGSWGYQVTGYFAASARYGSPADLMYLVDRLHQAGLGVIFDWVPGHFPYDPHALARFDGHCLFEHPDGRRGHHPDWDTAVFDYGRPEVQSFLISSARYWLDVFHGDGLRVDAVASMLYLDYSRGPGEWEPNLHGGNQNLEAVGFLRKLNQAIARAHPDAGATAEESTAWPGVSAAVSSGGLGFARKWDLGWTHDTLSYFRRDPVHRPHHHHEIVFRGVYAFTERFVLPLSHDEVAHGKGSLLEQMPGDRWQQLANLRALLAMQWLMPGKKLLFMGGEFGQPQGWNHDVGLDWAARERPEHAGVERLVTDLNTLLRSEPALYVHDHHPDGFRWVISDDASQSVFAWLRREPASSRSLLVVSNLTPVVRDGYRVGVPAEGPWRVGLDTDRAAYGGSGRGSGTVHDTRPIGAHGYAQSLTLTLPPLAVIVLASP